MTGGLVQIVGTEADAEVGIWSLVLNILLCSTGTVRITYFV